MPASTTEASSGTISREHFGKACRHLVICSKQLCLRAYDLSFDDECLVVRRTVKSTRLTVRSHVDEDSVESLEAIDEAALIRQKPVEEEIKVIYHILHSPSYQVPVLYFFLHGMLSDSRSGIDAVYQYLVPEHQKPAVKGVGVLGGVGMVDHPVSGVPCFWVHPCHTAEAMQELVKGMPRDVSMDEYLLVWIGLVGTSVGLTLPTELVLSYD